MRNGAYRCARSLVAMVLATVSAVGEGCGTSVSARVENSCDEPLNVDLLHLWTESGETPWVETVLAPGGVFDYELDNGSRTARGRVIRVRTTDPSVAPLDIPVRDGKSVQVSVTRERASLRARPIAP